MKNCRKKEGDGTWKISFLPILRYSAVFCIMTLLIILLGGAILAVGRMKSAAHAAMESSSAQSSQRVKETINLLEALAGLPEFYDPELPPSEKVRMLDQMSPQMGYLMMCYVDSDITVYSDGSEPVSLASRNYMQKLFSTGEPQVTDSFAAGADGVTLNYTVAVPLIDEQGDITGCLFSAIYFDEVVQILDKSTEVVKAEATLIGSEGQIMSSTVGLPYGDEVMDVLLKDKLFGTTADKLEEQLLAAIPGDFWSIHNGSLCYTAYQRVAQTGWDVLCYVNFTSVFQEVLPDLLFVSVLVALLCIVYLLVLQRYIKGQMQMVDMLVDSVEDLEKKIYQDEHDDIKDFREIIRLTKNGLSDSLTGVVTRSVFLNQAEGILKKADPMRVTALCFVDMDNLKYINDTYGHGSGDVALKSIGYILREYEKKYDGVVGRYGGDEFVLILLNLDEEKELRSVMGELVLRLHSDVGSAGVSIPVQCSVGVALYHPGDELEQLISDADEALYFVKQNGKGYYKIH